MLKKVDMSTYGKIIDSRELQGSLAVPSAAHGYSLCIEYAKKWFLSKISPSFFNNNIYIEGRYALEEYRRYTTIEEQIRKKNPALAIIPNLDIGYNRDFLDFTPNMTGINNYIMRSRLEMPFFSDPSRCIKLYMSTKAIQVGFTFKIRMDTKASQLDLRDFMLIAYKVGATWGERIDQDFHLPYQLMLNLAQDAGFEVKNKRVVNIMEYIRYLNKNSLLPVTYKFRGINGREEFFVRMKDMYVHTKVSEIDKDDGTRTNQLEGSFTIEMNTIVTYPVPQFYMYYSEVSHTNMPNTLGPVEENTIGIYSINLAAIPEVNDKGWELCLTTDVLEKDTTKPLYIDTIYDLFYSTNEEESDIQKILKYNKDLSINSDIFMDIQLYNNGKMIPCWINWSTYELKSDIIVDNEVSIMAIYIDKEYMNEYISQQDKINEARVN